MILLPIWSSVGGLRVNFFFAIYSLYVTKEKGQDQHDFHPLVISTPQSADEAKRGWRDLNMRTYTVAIDYLVWDLSTLALTLEESR